MSTFSEFPVQQNIAVDKSMVPYFGRLSGKMFIRGKPICFGYKIWSCCTQSGYLISLEPYQGASGQKETADYGVGGGVVLRLVESLPKNPYRVSLDNFFTSLPLLDRLREIGVGATGTVRANRVGSCPLKS